MNSRETEPFVNVKQAAETLSRMKATDIVVLDLRKLSTFTDYFLIGSGASVRQTKAICDEIEKEFKQQKVVPLHIEGYAEGNWIILDYYDFIIHLFSEDTRRYYESISNQRLVPIRRERGTQQALLRRCVL